MVKVRGAENIEKRRRKIEEKHWKIKRKKNEEYRESQITTINIFGFTFYIKNHILLENIACKRVVSTIIFYLRYALQDIWNAGYLKRRIFETLQDTWNAVMIQQSSYGFALVFRAHDLRPEIYVNRLGTATKIFIAIDYLILRSEKYVHFRKRQKYVARNFFAHPVEVTSVIFSEFCVSQRYKQNLKQIWIPCLLKWAPTALI